MTISVPKAKYNLLLDANTSRKRKVCSKRCLLISLLLVIFIPICLLFGAHFYILYNNSHIEKQAFTRAQLYAIDEYLHANFVGENAVKTRTESINEELIHPKLVCYYAYPSSWNSSDVLLPENINCNLCTHINIAFATIINHSIALSDNLKRAIPKVVELKKCNKDLKLLISVGGGGSDNGFPEMVTNHANRKDFIKSIKSVLQEYKLDGIDLDWEFPAVHSTVTSKMKNASENIYAKERQHFSQLLREIRTEYIREKRDYLLTLAVASPKFIVDAAYDVDQINLYADFVNLMTYDFHYYTPFTPFTGFNSPLFGTKQDTLYLSSLNINYTVNMWIDKGLDRSKLVVGLPTYGHSFTLINPRNSIPGSPAKGFGKTGGLGFVSYIDVCKFVENNKNVTIVFNNETMSPYLYKDSEWISYEDLQSISHKGMFIKANNFGGAMVYSLNADDFSGVCMTGSEKKFYLTRKLNNILIDKDL